MSRLILGDCIAAMAKLPANSVCSIVTDPPYELGFMGKSWDASGIAYSVEMWREALRVLKPGGHLLSFGGSRTYHRMACAIEDAGFEVRDQLQWIFGSGFPKSRSLRDIGRPELGSALKPAHEPIVLARKPLFGTIAANVQAHGTGAINIDGCRVATSDDTARTCNGAGQSSSFDLAASGERRINGGSDLGRWPANLIHDGSAEVLAEFAKYGERTTSKGTWARNEPHHWESAEAGTTAAGYGDTGTAARFFYAAKASKTDRDEGCDGFGTTAGVGALRDGGRKSEPRANHHPTVKPTSLMRYLVRLITPPGGTVLDPFTGSGSTGKAAALEGFNFIGIERDPEYFKIARARIAAAKPRASRKAAA